MLDWLAEYQKARIFFFFEKIVLLKKKILLRFS